MSGNEVVLTLTTDEIWCLYYDIGGLPEGPWTCPIGTVNVENRQSYKRKLIDLLEDIDIYDD